MDNLASLKNMKFNIKVMGSDFLENRPVIIAGPCSVEGYKVYRDIALKIKEAGANALRGGAFKPRTSPFEFQGMAFEGLKIIKEVKEEVGLPVVSELMDPRDVEPALDSIDIIQIGSRNMYNYSLLKEVAKTNIPVMLKRGMAASLKEWLYAAMYIIEGGNESVMLCERGIRTFENSTRNTLDLNSVALVSHKYKIPVIVDPSHGTGNRDLVSKMSLASIFAGASGLMIEAHTDPAASISDKDQTINIETLKSIIGKLNSLKFLN